MKNRIFVILLLLLTFPCQARIIYVDANTPDNNDGSSWATAYQYLQDALRDANSSGGVNEIWVAKGTHTPDMSSNKPIGTNDRIATFQLIKGVVLKGGYAGIGQPDPNVRNFDLYETILSGDLDGNDIQVDPCELPLEPTRGENSYQVVTASGADSNTILDGFTIMGGNANGGYYLYKGGGICNWNIPTPDWDCTGEGPMIINCKVTKNSANEGGGMFNAYTCQMEVINCVFVENMANWGGGAIKNDTSHPIITGCIFKDNFTGQPSSSSSRGGAIDNEEASPAITNCAFIGNSADYGGAISNWMGGCSPIIINCVFSNNSAEYGGVMWISNYHQIGDGSHPELANCTLAGNSAAYGKSLACTEGFATIIPSDIQITNCILWDGGNEIWNADGSTITVGYSDVQGGESEVYDPCSSLVWSSGNIDSDPCFVDPDNDDYHLLPDSPCIDTGDPNYVAEPDETDFDGNPRVIGDRIDMGAYEFDPLDLLIELSDNIDAMNLPKGTANSLQAKLNTALEKLEDDNENNDAAAINSLQAFINAVQAQRGKKISQVDADDLIEAAQQIIDILSD